LLILILPPSSVEYNNFGDKGTAAITAAIRSHPGALCTVHGVNLGSTDPHLPLELQCTTENGRILDFYRDLQNAGVVSRRCRLLLLGVGGVGKTTLARRLGTGGPSGGPPGVTHGALQRTCA
jgi:hypothetical protein